MKKYLIITAILIIAACGTKNPTEEPKEDANVNSNIVSLNEAQLKSAGIVLGKPEYKSIASILRASGTIDVPPQNMISISMPLGGYLKSSKLIPGMQVRKGETIAIMEDQQYIQLQQEYLTTKSKLVFSKAELDRQRELNQSKASSDKIFQQAQMDYSNLSISLNSLAQKLRMINLNPNNISENNISRTVPIYSPIAGTVSKVNVNIGRFINPSDILFEIIDPSNIHLNLKIFEKDLAKLSKGQKLIAYTNNQPDKKYPCEISLITGDLSAERTAEVHCHFESFDKTLVPGMYMNAEIEIKSHETLAIPEDAIVRFEGLDYVFVKKGEREFEMKTVETGVKENKYVELINSAAFSDKEIVIKGAYTLLMSLKNKSEE
ncbi:MAG: efflux RND transporter periplasmic adaptor subunit [Daejeonella sp.]|uniref:efflux RND transporter periplasmic adaptor subunit n=1 Tax=Daejeonella sp. TaxID=2805397 RepID=UPI002735226E|nr:efflux RND transporter periplasmic adaptor subunit [Daejeonella sp.]MDP3469033.1 efflux RND transporter periplasmic adaptor subunit [Daejeonella sp.]